MPPVIDFAQCAGCGQCENSCPLDVIYFDAHRKEPEIRYPEECWHCGSCRLDCPEEAITIRFPMHILVSAGVAPY